MDDAHPITIFLIRHGYLVRGTAIGLLLCVMLNTGFISLGELQPETPSKLLYFGLFLLGAFSPSMAHFVVSPTWQKITPINDRITYVEDEIVFIGSTLLGLTGALFVWGITSISQGFMISLWAVLAALPVFFLVWFIKSTLTPLKYEDTTVAVVAAQTFRNETPHFWNNALAYVISGVVTALVLTLAFMLIIAVKGGGIAVGTGCMAFTSMVLVNIVAAPLFIWIGRKFRPRDASPNGIHLLIGATLFLTVIVLLNASAIFKDGFDLPGLLSAWHFIAAYCLMILSYIGGGIAFSKFYKPRPAALEFA